MTANQTAVIIGTGLAGGNAAVTLREGGWSGRIVMLGAESGIPFGRPPLSKTYLRGEESLSGWLVKPEDWYADNRVELRAGVRVQGVDTKLKKVTLQGEETVAYDKLLLCTGGKNRRFQVPGAEAPDVYQLRTMAECDAIRRAAQPGARALIVGMGFIGSEVAASLRQLGLEVSAVLSGTAPLTAVLGNQVAEVMARMHRNHGVQLVTDDRVVGFEGSEHLAGAMTAKGARIECDLAVVAIGIDPNVDAVRSSGIALDNGILVDETCRTSAPDVFAAGDVANHLHPVFGRVRVEHYNNAEKQGRAAARAMPGSGLGLAIVKQVVLKHGGALRVEDTVAGGQPPGTSIYVLLPGQPMAVADYPDDGEDEADVSSSSTPGNSPAPANVISVESQTTQAR